MSIAIQLVEPFERPKSVSSLGSARFGDEFFQSGNAVGSLITNEQTLGGKSPELIVMTQRGDQLFIGRFVE